MIGDMINHADHVEHVAALKALAPEHFAQLINYLKIIDDLHVLPVLHG